MKLRSHKIEFFFIVSLITAAFLFIVLQEKGKETRTVRTSAAAPIETPIPTPYLSSMDSPEGSKILTLKRDDTTTYSLSVMTKDDSQEHLVFKKDESNQQKLEIPFNAWDPNNAYIFLKEITPIASDYLVIKSSGDLFPSDVPFISIQELFQKKIQNYRIADVTGWAAPNLLLVNAIATTGDQKVSFWFDIPSQSFIQLGTYFK